MATRDSKTATDLGNQAMALAEQLGRIAGTIEGTAEAWVNRRKLMEQLSRVRDGAAHMLDSLGARQKRAPRAKRVSAAATRRTDPAHAPGKRRRKPAPNQRGVKKSDLAIPKMRTARAVRQRRKSYA